MNSNLLFWALTLEYVLQVFSQNSTNEIPVLTSSIKLTNWDRERIIFDNEYYQLGKDLVDVLLGPNANYNKKMMPLISDFHENPQVTVGLHFRLVQMVNLDTNTEDLELVYVTQYYWFDPQLVWYKPNFRRNPYSPLPKSWKNVLDPATNQTKSASEISLQDILVSFHDVKKKYFEKSDKVDELGHILDFFLNPSATEELLPNNFYNYYEEVLTEEDRKNLEKYRTVQFLKLSPSEIWTPDIVLYNANDGKHFEHVNYLEDQTDVTCFSDGLCIWEPIIHHTISCALALGNFPYDVQLCYLDFGSWYYSSSNMKIKLANTSNFLRSITDRHYLYNKKIDSGFTEGPVDSHSINNLGTNLDHGEWSFLAGGVRIGKESFEIRSWVRFYLILERNPINYVLNVLVTCILMSLSTGWAFFIPAGGDRLSLIFAVLITMSVYQMLTSEITPNGSTQTPILSIMILGFIVLITLTSFICMILIRLVKIKTDSKKFMNEILWSFTTFLIRIVGAGKKFTIYRKKFNVMTEKLETDGVNVANLDEYSSLQKLLYRTSKVGKYAKMVQAQDSMTSNILSLQDIAQMKKAAGKWSKKIKSNPKYINTKRRIGISKYFDKGIYPDVREQNEKTRAAKEVTKPRASDLFSEELQTTLYGLRVTPGSKILLKIYFFDWRRFLRQILDL